MPTPYKRIENMAKHMTKAEREARLNAEQGLRHATPRVIIKAPKWLSPEARAIFDQTKKRMASFEVLESSDADVLALYADAVANYKTTVDALKDTGKGADVAQSWSRLALSLAEKLGISASGRARLARKKAQKEDPDALESLLDDISDFVNDGEE